MGEEEDAERHGLAEFLRHNRERALAEWQDQVGQFPPAKILELEALRDNVPVLLDHIMDAVEGHPIENDEVPDLHARVRLDQGFSLDQVAEEYRLLRAALLHLLETEQVALDAKALRLLNNAIDVAVGRALSRYHHQRSLALAALERISQEAFASHGESLRDFLHRLLEIVLDSTEADAAAIYLREWDRVVIRAAAGFEVALEEQEGLRIGEGIAGTVAATREPYLSRSASTDPKLKDPAVVAAKLKAMCALPLVYGDDLIGVAVIGSRSAAEFSDDDKQLFRDVAQRVAVLITHRRLAEEREVFIGVLGHDLRSPLNTVTLGIAYLGKRERLSAPAQQVVRRVASAAQRMAVMVGGLADYTRVRFGAGLAIERGVMDLGDALQKLVAELRSQRPDRSLKLEVKGDVVGEWDSMRLGQVVSNLVNNAVAYGDPSSPIAITADGTEERTVGLSVHNLGDPIPGSQVPLLFDAFRRGTTEAEGMGLGLYIVQHIARAHRGTVEVESTLEHGTTFTVRLPRWS